MPLTMREKRAIVRETAEEYRKASKKQKAEILNRFCWITKYNKSYAARLLRQNGSKKILGTIRVAGQRVVFIKGGKPKPKRKRPRTYGPEVASALKKIWAICDGICGKRLAPFLPEIVPILESFGELKITDEVREKLFKMSSATIDRLLRPLKRSCELKPRHKTKPGSLLKHQIPVRTFADWDESRPGFMETDLVSHDGGILKGDFAQSLDAVDVCSSWTETIAVKNRAQKWVFEGLTEMEKRLPFPLLGLDSDNDSAFINDHLFRYCREKQITFTRSRPYRKNDSCYVEQKNYSVVRRTVGYLRYDTEEELKTLNQLYRILRLYANFFQPVMKLKQKMRIGSKVKKTYDEARTPYQRLLESPYLEEESKQRLREQYSQLNPAALKRKITKLQKKLWQLASLKEELRKKEVEAKDKDFEYISDEATNPNLEYIFT